MREIEVKILNPEVITDAENMMVAMARLTQKGHTIKSMEDLENLLAKDYKQSTAKTMVDLPHPTIQKFGVINIAVVGASRRFLAQITRHQNEVKYMSASLQYSDYSGAAEFTIPYEITKLGAEDRLTRIIEPGGRVNWYENQYLKSCRQAVAEYEAAIEQGVPHDAAGYMLPQGLRNVLIISATPYQIKHMISQRTCSRNTLETQYVMLKIWEELFETSILFKECGPKCMYAPNICPEGNMFCGEFPVYASPTAWLDDKFVHIRRGK